MRSIASKPTGGAKKKSFASKRPSSSSIFLAVVAAVVIIVQLRIFFIFHSQCQNATIFTDTFKNKGPMKPNDEQSPEYSFDKIPSRKWKIYEHQFPCYPPGKDESNHLMQTTPAHEGLLFQRPTKVGSTTFNNVVLRLVHNRGVVEAERFEENSKADTIDTTLWKDPVRCKYRAMHGASIKLDYANRDKKRSFLFSLVRDPTRRSISEYFHFRVSYLPEDPTDENFAKHVIRPRSNNFLLRMLTFDPNLPIRMSVEYEHFFKTHKEQQREKGIVSGVKLRELDKALLQQGTLSEAIDYTKIVQEILNDYDFIAVTERMDESLVAMKLLLGLTVEEIVYAKISRTSGSFSNGPPKDRPCMYLVPSFLTTRMKDFFYTPQKNDLWLEHSKGDALLHKAVSRSLDRTIDEVFGRERFDSELAEFKNALAYTQAVCSSEPDLVLGMCDDGGNVISKDPNRTNTCYIWAEGCDQKCVNERVPSPIPKTILQGIQRFGDEI